MPQADGQDTRLGVAVGVLWLKEEGTTMRVLGAGLVAAGVVAIKLLG